MTGVSVGDTEESTQSSDKDDNQENEETEEQGTEVGITTLESLEAQEDFKRQLEAIMVATKVGVVDILWLMLKEHCMHMYKIMREAGAKLTSTTKRKISCLDSSSKVDVSRAVCSNWRRFAILLGDFDFVTRRTTIKIGLTQAQFHCPFFANTSEYCAND